MLRVVYIEPSSVMIYQVGIKTVNTTTTTTNNNNNNNNIIIIIIINCDTKFI